MQKRASLCEAKSSSGSLDSDTSDFLHCIDRFQISESRASVLTTSRTGDFSCFFEGLVELFRFLGQSQVRGKTGSATAAHWLTFDDLSREKNSSATGTQDGRHSGTDLVDIITLRAEPRTTLKVPEFSSNKDVSTLH